MKNYLDVLRHVVDAGRVKGNRTGVGTKYLFSEKFRHNMADGFPLLTTKKINPQQVVGELFGFLTAKDSVEGFKEFGCNIWDAWGLEQDLFKLVLRNEADYATEYARVKELEPEAAAEAIAKVQKDNVEWVDEYQKLMAKISNGEIETEFDEPLETLQEKVSEHLAKKPKSVIEFLASEGVEIHVKDLEYAKGYLGPIYGKQWLEWVTSKGEVINQLKRVAHQLEHTPLSRRIILTAWNPEFVPADKYANYPNGLPALTSHDQVQCAIQDGKQALPPCHLMVILDVDVDAEAEETILNMEVIMRSTDVPVGLPFNIASYGFLMAMIASQFGFTMGDLVIEMVNCHVYVDQLEPAEIQLARTPGKLPDLLPIPQDIKFDEPSTLTPENLQRVLNCLIDYNPQGFIKYPVAV